MSDCVTCRLGTFEAKLFIDRATPADSKRHRDKIRAMHRVVRAWKTKPFKGARFTAWIGGKNTALAWIDVANLFGLALTKADLAKLAKGMTAKGPGEPLAPLALEPAPAMTPA